MTLRLRFWGTRGSVPSPGPATVRYGGNTPCIEVRTDTDWLIILDAGTGIRDLGRSLVASSNGNGIAADIFLTHAHWDHIQGIPFFAPIFHQGNRFTIWGSTALEKNLGRVIREQMSPVVFPVPFDALGADVRFSDVTEGQHSGSGYMVKTFPVRHPGGALGYRFWGRNEADSSFVYISDNEMGAAEKYPSQPQWDADMVRFVAGAKTLIHDATYTAEEYEKHRGWGHSTYDDALTLALAAGVEQLVLFHHRPERSDEELDRCVAHCQAVVASRGSGLTVIAAAEGMTLTV
jgi:phosphoribosyl 1,2-cyclic phosphodiesterase